VATPRWQEGGATHTIEGTLRREASFELSYSQSWVDISQIQGGLGGTEAHKWRCKLASSSVGEWCVRNGRTLISRRVSCCPGTIAEWPRC
jgi:hypothetical protein